MIKKIRQIWRSGMLRPAIYMTFTRAVLALFIVLLADFFFSPKAGHSLKETLFLLAAALFAALLWVAWLRLDGVRLPKLLMLRVNPRKKPARMYGDMIDYVGENAPETFEELEDDEKDVCILFSDAVCCVMCLILAAVY